MRVLIIGAGIVGLTAGACLSRAGFEVIVCERNERLRADGAGITLWPNALDIFETFGVGEPIVAAGYPVANLRVLDPDGREASTYRGFGDIEERFGWPVIVIYRPTLSEILAETLPAGALRFSARLVDLKQTDNTVTAYFGDGSSESADVLIGADGIWSTVRRWVDANAEPEFNDQVMWRGVVHDATVTDSAITLAGDLRASYIPLGGGRVYWLVGKFGLPAHQPHDQPITEALALVEGWTHITPVIRRTDPGEALVTDIFRLTSLRTWHAGRVALAGDAAHAESPHVMIGACLGVEDAFDLTRALSAERDPRGSIAAYSAARSERLRWTQSEAARIATLSSEEHGRALRELQETLLATAPLQPGSMRPTTPDPRGSEDVS